jgi:hypothetical protein
MEKFGECWLKAESENWDNDISLCAFQLSPEFEHEEQLSAELPERALEALFRDQAS